MGGGPVESMVIMEEFGRALVVEPFVPTVVIAGGLLAQSGGALAEEILPTIAAGETIIAFAFAEPQGRYNLADITTTAKKQGDGYVLNGQKSVVLGRALGGPLDRHGAHGRRSARGKRRQRVPGRQIRRRHFGTDYAAMSGVRASDLVFENVPARLIGEEGEAIRVIGSGGGPRHRCPSGRSLGRHRGA